MEWKVGDSFKLKLDEPTSFNGTYTIIEIEKDYDEMLYWFVMRDRRFFARGKYMKKVSNLEQVLK